RALEDPPGRRAGADRARRAVAVALAVRARPAAEAVALDHALEAAALRRPGDVHQLAGLEHIGCEHLADGVLLDVIGGELAQVAHQAPGGLQVPLARARQALGRDLAEPELDGLVAIALLGADLRHHTRPNFEHRHRNHLAGGAEHLSHADLAAEQSLYHNCTSTA